MPRAGKDALTALVVTVQEGQKFLVSAKDPKAPIEIAVPYTTGWSRWSVCTLQCVPIDAALDSLVATGVILHDGELPAGGVQACVDALEGQGEKQRFEACRKAMERLTDIRSGCCRSPRPASTQSLLRSLTGIAPKPACQISASGQWNEVRYRPVNSKHQSPAWPARTAFRQQYPTNPDFNQPNHDNSAPSLTHRVFLTAGWKLRAVDGPSRL